MQEPGHENSVLIAFVTSEGFREHTYLHSPVRVLLFTLIFWIKMKVQTNKLMFAVITCVRNGFTTR